MGHIPILLTLQIAVMRTWRKKVRSNFAKNLGPVVGVRMLMMTHTTSVFAESNLGQLEDKEMYNHEIMSESMVHHCSICGRCGDKREEHCENCEFDA